MTPSLEELEAVHAFLEQHLAHPVALALVRAHAHEREALMAWLNEVLRVRDFDTPAARETRRIQELLRKRLERRSR